MLTLGIDPGLARIGYGVVSSDGDIVALLDYGCLETHPGTPYPDRLKYIYDGVRRLVRRYKPDAVALESLFFFRNARTVMRVSEARGVIVLAIGTCHVPAFEYTPQQVKQAVSSYGMELSLIHISEPTRLGMISYAVFCLKKKKKKKKKQRK